MGNFVIPLCTVLVSRNSRVFRHCEPNRKDDLRHSMKNGDWKELLAICVWKCDVRESARSHRGALAFVTRNRPGKRYVGTIRSSAVSKRCLCVIVSTE